MRIILLRLRLIFNKWYLSQLQYRALWRIGIAKIDINKAIREQKGLILTLEELIYENCNTK